MLLRVGVKSPKASLVTSTIDTIEGDVMSITKSRVVGGIFHRRQRTVCIITTSEVCTVQKHGLSAAME